MLPTVRSQGMRFVQQMISEMIIDAGASTEVYPE